MMKGPNYTGWLAEFGLRTAYWKPLEGLQIAGAFSQIPNKVPPLVQAIRPLVIFHFFDKDLVASLLYIVVYTQQDEAYH